MKNPFRSEAEAFRLVVATIVYLGLIALASLVGGLWWGIGVFIAVSVAGGVWLLRASPPARPARTAPVRRREKRAGERRILVIANETVGGRALQEIIRERTTGCRARVLVVAPALNSPVGQLTSDDDGARLDARTRLEASLALLSEGGIDASGEVGDADPLQAIEDALRTFGPDELIVSTHPEGRSNWLERGVVSAARERFAVPLTHVVVDLGGEQEEVR